jgi:hypothetical protein
MLKTWCFGAGYNKRVGIKTRTVEHGNPLASDHQPLIVRLELKDCRITRCPSVDFGINI